MASARNFIDQLNDVGSRLLDPPTTTPELLSLLDETVVLLSQIKQAPSQLVQDALLSTMKALISDKLMRNSDIGVVVTTTACLNEIMRISAPIAPYDDEKMKEIFELIVLSFNKLSSPPGRCYSKAMLILESVARLRSCIMMLDLDCDSLVIKMFEVFMEHVSLNHPQSVGKSMEKIMSFMIIESDSLPEELVKVLLDSIRKENKNKLPAVYNMGVKVVEECSEKLRPYIMEAVTSMGSHLDDFAPVLSSICEAEPVAVEGTVHDSAKYPPSKPLERCSPNLVTDLETASEKGETHYSLNLDDGDDSLTGREKKSPGSPHVHMKNSSVAPRSKKKVPLMEDEPDEAADLDMKKVHQAIPFGGSSDKKGKPAKKDVSGGSRKKSTTGLSKKGKIQTNDAVRSQRKTASSDDDVFETPHGRKNYREDLVGCRIKVWWPLDRRYYEGTISSFDALTKKHKVDYDDGDEEVLNLRAEQWEFVGDEISTDIEFFADKKHQQPRPDKPKREASAVREKESSKTNFNKRDVDVMPDFGDEANDKSHQAAKFVEKVKTPEGLSDTKRPKLSEGPKSMI